ncbi:DNA-binding protein RFX5 [Triplophysa tibetana]|uniref:DNA-binding protein RFX5 n=1 Tax=Triplophysa tibetana TaxID=1572043 RepID=A0A5A9NLD8_9TELE|nr:DNA-binding protein RFX5 [Triplophysa tibetana]
MAEDPLKSDASAGDGDTEPSMLLQKLKSNISKNVQGKVDKILSELTELVQTYKQEVTEAACELICDWAQKILKRSFDTVVEIARFLVQEHIVNPRCSQAELVTSAALAGGTSKPHRVIKKTPATSRTGAEEESGSVENKQKEKDGVEQPPANKQQVSDKPNKVESARMEACMKKFHQILPRGSIPEKTSPTCLAPSDSGNVQVTLPITVATIPSQAGATVPFMVTVATSAAQTPVVQRARPPAPKRGPDPSASAPGLGAVPMKRKRGRPRKQRPEDALPQVQLGQPSNPNPALLTGGVIQKAMSSCAPAHPSQLLEIMIQDQQSLVLSQLPAVQEVTDAERRGVVVHSQPAPEPENHQSVVILPGPNQPSYELSRGVVIKRTPLSREGRPVSQEAVLHLPPPTIVGDRGEVEITLTPVEDDSMLNSTGISSSFGSSYGETLKPDTP